MSNWFAAIASRIRSAAIAVFAGFLSGVVTLGIGCRLAMRIVALMASDADQGTLTDATETVGDITVAGTIFLLLLGGAAGTFGGILYAATRRRLEWAGRWRGVIFGIGALVVLASTLVVSDNPDFARFGTPIVNVAMFGSLFVLFGVVITPVYDALQRAVLASTDGLAGYVLFLVEAAGLLLTVPATSIVRPLGLPVRGLPPNSRITKIDIITRESPTFGGYSWPGVGQYEKLVGKAFGQVDPTDPKNAVIVDLLLAPQNARGYVEYSFDFYILKPIDLTKGAHKVMYEPPNRGRKTWASLGRVTSGGNDPGSITNVTELASAFLMPRGYTLVWSGWDASAGNDNAGFVTTMAFPIAKNRDGSSITGPAYEYIVSPGSSYTLNYPAATLNQADATLTHRVKLNDPPQVITRRPE